MPLTTKDFLDAINKCDERIRQNWIAFVTLSYGVPFFLLNRDHRCWIVNWSWASLGDEKTALLREKGLNQVSPATRTTSIWPDYKAAPISPDILWMYDPKEILLIAYIVFSLFFVNLLVSAYADRHEWIRKAQIHHRVDALELPRGIQTLWLREKGVVALLWALGRGTGFLAVFGMAVYGICTLCWGRNGRWFFDSGLNLSPWGSLLLAAGITLVGSLILVLARTSPRVDGWLTQAGEVKLSRGGPLSDK
ncbi:MAG TPA: hypothetical protein VJ890_28365 [Vineibacter sp.]|nr:hypothetical protein [Vineibacter sp.]